MRTRSSEGRSLSIPDGPAIPASVSSSSPSPSPPINASYNGNNTNSNNNNHNNNNNNSSGSGSSRHGDSVKTKRKETRNHTSAGSSGFVSARSSVDIPLTPPIPDRSARRTSTGGTGNTNRATWTNASTFTATTFKKDRFKRDSDSEENPFEEQTTPRAVSKKAAVTDSVSAMNPLYRGRGRLRSPWTCSLLTLSMTLFAGVLVLIIMQSFLTRQLDPQGCAMSYMRPAFAKFSDFDTEHTRFASKYSLYLYREGGIDEDTRVKGTPVLFIPGNAGSYKQVRPIAAEAAVFFHDRLQNDNTASSRGKRPLDFFSVDFNEDITAFHGQTLLDQAEYLNEAVAYILSLYHNPNRSIREPELPDPTSVILIGHSMGGVVARTMLTLPNYQSNSINTIITLSAPHARAPVSFDSDIVHTYQRINDYWRHSYSQKWANDNPLWHVTLISIAGGGLDTVVPSDYSTIASLVPPTHGFTVFTSTIPNVWTGMDHLCITWCDQFRKSLVRSLYDVVDAGRPSQTLPRVERMIAFKRWFLTGFEDIAEKTLTLNEPHTLLTLQDDSNSIISQGERLTLRQLGATGRRRAYLLPIPSQNSAERKRFALLTNQHLDRLGQNDGLLEVMFCSIYPPNNGQYSTVFSSSIDLSVDGVGSTKLACRNAADDVILLPASIGNSKYPFDDARPFSYFQYELEQLNDYQFVAVVDKSTQLTPGWVIAEFHSKEDATFELSYSLVELATRSVHLVPIPTDRPMVTEIKIPSIYSSLLAYHLKVEITKNGEQTELFAPFVRQSISEPYESKFFVNVKEADISMHGIAPFVPLPLRFGSDRSGLSLQVWSDPTINSTAVYTFNFDVLGSMGKLWMRYRTVFAALPVMVVALVLRKQFMHYDETGVFMSFAEGLDLSLRRSLPLLVFILMILGITTSSSAAALGQGSRSFWSWRSKAQTGGEAMMDFAENDRLMGSPDPFLWFLLPLFAVISVGVCVVLNYVVSALIFFCSIVYGRSRKHLHGRSERKRSNSVAVAPFRRRLVITIILLVLVSTVIPYQFVYIVLCIVQLATCVRLMTFARDTYATNNLDFYNYAHSIFILMLWILPINLPVLVVWSRNLAVHWLTPFSSHHNVLSITPFVLLIETLETGKMIPRSHSLIPRQFTSWLFMLLACYAAVYGVVYAYLLHGLVNALCTWLVAVHINGLGLGPRRNLLAFIHNITASSPSSSLSNSASFSSSSSSSSAMLSTNPGFSTSGGSNGMIPASHFHANHHPNTNTMSLMDFASSDSRKKTP